MTTADYLIKQRRSRRIAGVPSRSSRNRVRGMEIVVIRVPSAVSAADDARSYVLVHGIGASSWYFHRLAAELSQTGSVILIDLPGYGASPNPRRRVSIAEHAEVLVNVLQSEGITNPVLIGHSMGTQVVSRIAVDHPEISDRLVLLAPTTNPAERTLGMQARRLFSDVLRESPAANAIVALDYFVRCGVPYFLSQVPNLLEDHIEDRLADVMAHTLVLRGDRDPLVPREWAERVAALIPRGIARELAGPHVIMHWDPAGTAAHIVDHARS